MTPRAKLYLVGMPLNEEAPLDARQYAALNTASLLIGESRKVFFRRRKEAENSRETFFLLDNIRSDEKERLHEELRRISGTSESVALFSDHGLPVLFDPGREIVEFCRGVGFEIHSVPGPCSWAIACAASLYPPPFLLHGFLPQKSQERNDSLRRLASRGENIVLLETPYRFQTIVCDLKMVTPNRELFLAWEMGNTSERLFWGEPAQLARYIREENLNKGEFVIILKGTK